jgi:ferrochelatase
LKKIEKENLDVVICYQRRLGPLDQIGPTTKDQIEKAATDNKNIIIVPISYVSECSETLVELNIQYKEVAAKAGIKDYILINTVRDSEKFIAGMSNLIMRNRV